LGPHNFQATLLAIREVHKKLYFGIRESEAQRMMAAALSAAGFQDGGCLTLYGGMFGSSSLLSFYTEKSTLDNAALPHGGGTDKRTIVGMSKEWIACMHARDGRR
jgi:hypothetical protein